MGVVQALKFAPHTQGIINYGVVNTASIFRSFSTAPPPQDNNKAKSGAMTEFNMDDYDDYEEPETAGGKVAMWTRIFLQFGFLAAIAGCFVVAARELFPGPTSPNSMYSRGVDVARSNAEVLRITGDDAKAYGRSVGRRHIDSRAYVHEDGSNRTRIRFNIQGKKGRVMVWAEMSDRMGDVDEFAYLIAQCQRTGKVITIHDNRNQLDQLPPNDEVGAIGKMIAGLMK